MCVCVSVSVCPTPVAATDQTLLLLVSRYTLTGRGEGVCVCVYAAFTAFLLTSPPGEREIPVSQVREIETCVYDFRKVSKFKTK